MPTANDFPDFVVPPPLPDDSFPELPECGTVDLMATGIAWLAEKLPAVAGQPIVYERDGNRIALCVTLGRKLLLLDDQLGGVRVEYTDRDYLIPAVSLVFDGEPITPRRGDLIYEVRDGRRQKFEVWAPGIEPPWRWSDPYHKTIRVHCKLVQTTEEA